ncbi:cytidine/deoxycytidylate deaminase [Clostridium sp. CAG:1219]|nr:cytidine/deoxycytidylate deaminase [Clostridium sp. CAG:1219]
MNEYMKIAKENADNGIKNKEGGPFGAVIVDKDGKIISNGNNKVIKNNDPTAHAEIVAIRQACEKLNTYDLSEYKLYTSCEPCPMCLSAIIWANIKEVYYGCTKEDAGEIGFRDDIIYDYLKGKNNNLISLKQMNREECIKTFEKYKLEGGILY